MNKVLKCNINLEYYLDFNSRETYLAKVAVWKHSYKRRVRLVQLEKRQARATAHQRNEVFSLFQTSNFYYKEWYRWPTWAVAALKAGLKEIADRETESNRQQALLLGDLTLTNTSVEKLVSIRQLMKAKSQYLWTLSHPRKTQPPCPTQLSLHQTAPALQLQARRRLGWY